MREKILAVIGTLIIGHGVAEEKPPMKPLPSLEQILAELPVHTQDANEKRIKMLSPYSQLVSVKNVITAYEQGAIIEAKHPEQKWGSAHYDKPEYKENDAYFWLVAHILYWKCNVAEFIPPVEQIKFMRKQHSILQDRWVDVVVNVKLEPSRKLALECLRSDLCGAAVCSSFYKHTEWWGEPARLIDPAECGSWSWDAKHYLIQLVRYSKDDEFKAKLAQALYEDKSNTVRETIAKMIEAGRLPDPTKLQSKQKMEPNAPNLSSEPPAPAPQTPKPESPKAP